jgi:signal transduction histidine kinase
MPERSTHRDSERLALLGRLAGVAGERLRGVLAESRDLPFTSTYVLGPDGNTTLSHSTGREPDREGLTWPIAGVLRSNSACEITGPDGGGVVAVGLPLIGPTRTHGVLIAGLDNTIPLDDSYHAFLRAVASCIATHVAASSAVAREGELMHSLASAQHQADSATRAKSEFFAILGHELRNPLAPIRSALQLIRMDPKQPFEKERSVIERQVEHLVALVDDLLDVSRITRGKVELKFKAIDLADIAARALDTVASLTVERKHQVVNHVPRDLKVRGDGARLTQVLVNLLTNSAKYTPVGGKITISGDDSREDEIAICVVDNGIGIEADMLPKVFTEFAQAPQSYDRARGGLGLGLAIVENIVRLHGGSVTARSAGRNMGSEFRIILPALHMTSLASATRTSVQVPVRGSERLLVVDDNEDAADMLAELLSTFGYQVRVYYDATSALANIEHFNPDLAILDLGLPDVDGHELARQIQARPALAHTKLIALTGYGQPQDRQATASSGFAAHMVKPVDIGKLRGLIDKLVAP